MCFIFAPASEWKNDIEWIAHHTHSGVKKRAALLVFDCSNKLALSKSKQPWRKNRMCLTCYKKECNFFMWVAIVFTSATGRKIPSLRRGKGDVEKRHQEPKQKASIQHQRHRREDYEGFLMCDNGFNSLGSLNIFHGLIYRDMMREVWESYKFYVQRMKEDSSDDPDPTLRPCLHGVGDPGLVE